MSSMNQRFRKLVGSTRRSTSSNTTSTLGTSGLGNNPSSTSLVPPPASSSSAASAATNGTTTAQQAGTTSPNSLSTTSNAPNPSASPPPPNQAAAAAAQAVRSPAASTTSLAMNPQQTPPGRPPSYQYANAGNNLGAPQHPNAGRPTSPMPPPPINTGGGGHGYQPQHQQMYGQPAPPGYPMQQQQPPPQAYGYGAPMAQPLAYTQRLAEVEGSQRSKAQLIVGIDFGTTFSGVAFAFATNTEAKEDIIVEWPGAGTTTKQKIPTVLYYDQHQQVVGWGPDIAEALAPTGYPKPGVQKVEWFKLQLMLSGNTYIDPINLPPLPPGKSEIDVAADYLFKLRQAMRNALQKTLGEVFNREERNIRYFLTVPAIWNDAGKAATRAAAIQAGFLRDENDNRLTLITEPEAAAMFCAKAGLLNLKVHDALLIVDCGGGTVDLIAYEVEEENPFTVAECTAGSGDSCGSTALNRNFSNILRAKIRKMKLPDGSKTAGKVYAKCIMDFENRIKADFRNNGQKWAVDVGIEAEFPEAGIEEGYMTFTNEEILQCFEPVVNRILELVRNQIIAIQAQNRSLQVQRLGRRRFRRVGIPLPADQAARAAAVPEQGGPPHGLGGGHREGRGDGGHHGARHHVARGPPPLPHGHAAAVQGGPPPGAVPRPLARRQGPLQVHAPDLRAEGPARQDRRARQGLLLPPGRARRHAHVRGRAVRVRRGRVSRVHEGSPHQGDRHPHLRPQPQEPRKRLRAHGDAPGYLLPRLLRHLPHPRRQRVQRRVGLPGRSHGTVLGEIPMIGPSHFLFPSSPLLSLSSPSSGLIRLDRKGESWETDVSKERRMIGDMTWRSGV